MENISPYRFLFSPDDWKIYSQLTLSLSPNQIIGIGKITYTDYHIVYPTKFLVLYRNSMNEYLSLIPKKQSQTMENFWVCDIHHYLQLLLDGQFDRSYYLSHGEMQWDGSFIPFQSQLNQFLTDCNHRSVYKAVSNLYQFNRKYLPKRNRYQKINFLQAFQHQLVAEQILRNIPFQSVSSNVYQLKKNHPFEPYIDQFIQLNTGIENLMIDDQPISEYLSRSLLEVLDTHLVYLKKLSEKDKTIINYPELVQKGNQLFLGILSYGLS